MLFAVYVLSYKAICLLHLVCLKRNTWSFWKHHKLLLSCKGHLHCFCLFSSFPFIRLDPRFLSAVLFVHSVVFCFCLFSWTPQWDTRTIPFPMTTQWKSSIFHTLFVQVRCVTYAPPNRCEKLKVIGKGIVLL